MKQLKDPVLIKALQEKEKNARSIKSYMETLGKEYFSDVEELLFQTIRKAENSEKFKGKDFYLDMVTTWEKLMKLPIFRIFPRLSCPTPRVGQTVWHYDHLKGKPEFLWTLPVYEKYKKILDNLDYLLTTEEFKLQALFVAWAASGDLLKYVAKRNGEVEPPTIGDYDPGSLKQGEA